METLTKSTSEILGDAPARDVLLEIFADLHPGLIDESRSITSIFTPQSAREFLARYRRQYHLVARMIDGMLSAERIPPATGLAGGREAIKCNLRF